MSKASYNIKDLWSEWKNGKRNLHIIDSNNRHIVFYDVRLTKMKQTFNKNDKITTETVNLSL